MLTLLDGRSVSLDTVNFDPTTQRFYLGNEEITWQIKAADKRQNFTGYDQARTNQIAYEDKYRREHGGDEPPPTGSTSALGLFTEQILTKPLDAPLEAVDNAVKDIFASSGVKTILTVGAVGLILFVGYKASKTAGS